MQKLSRLLKSLHKYLVAATILAIPLYQKFPLIRVRGTFVSIRLEDFLIAALALTTFILLIPRFKQIFEDKVTKAIALFLLVAAVSLISGIYLTKTISLSIGLLHWIRRVEYLVPFFAGALAIKLEKKNLEFYIKLIVIVILFAFVYGVGQKHLAWPIIVTQNQEYSKGVALRYLPGSHINSTFAGHYDLATYLIVALPVIISTLVLIKKTSTRIFLLAAGLSGLWLLVNAVSRISIVSYLTGTILALSLLKKYKVIPFVVIISFVLMLFMGLSTNLFARYTRIIDVTKEKFLKINNLTVRQAFAAREDDEFLLKRKTPLPTPTPTPIFEDRSTSIRLNVEWPRALRALAKNPLLGTGYSSITLATDNDYLRMLGETGILGFLAFFAIWTRIAFYLVKLIPLVKKFQDVELAFMSGIIGSLPGVFLNAFFIDVFEASKFAILFWLFIGMILQLAKSKNYG